MDTTSTARPSAIDRYFEISRRGSTVGREVRGGFVTFFAMAYILAVNPSILAAAAGDAIPVESLAAGTALTAGVMTVLMGVVAKFPIAMAAGMGINAIVSYTLVLALGLTYQEAMGLVFWEGVVITILVLTGLRKAVFEAVPQQLKTAISVGIGLFIAFVGLLDAGIVRLGTSTPGFGINGSLDGWPSLVFVVGLVLTIVLYVRKVKGSILISIVAATVLAVIVEAVADIGARSEEVPTGWSGTVPELSGSPVSIPDFSSLLQIDFFGAFEKLPVISVLLIIFSLMLADFFDTMGTMVAVGAEANLLDETGAPPRSQRILFIDSLGAVAGGLAGVSSNTSYIESSTGVGEGARTGLASVVTGVLFLLAMFFSPLVGLVPIEAASPALVFVGFLMMTQVLDIDWKSPEIAIPAFLTIAFMPFAYSISVGIGVGFVAYVIVKVAIGKAREVHPLMWAVAALFVVYFALAPIESLLAG